jgi:hypothetical protein
MATEPDLRACTNGSACLHTRALPDGALELWSDRRPDQRITLDADEVPAWLRPVDADLRTLAAEGVAQCFHEAYERLAPDFGYRTREASAKPWPEVPERNRALMVATVDAVLAAVLPAHRRQVLDEAADAILGELRYINTDRTCIERHAGIVRRLAATAPSAGHSGSRGDERAEVVPHDAPNPHRPSEGVRSCPTCHSIGERRALTTDGWTDLPAADPAGLERCADLWHVEVREPTPVHGDCGHDLEAFERQARELTEISLLAGKRADRLVLQGEALDETTAERDRLADTIRRYQPVIDAVVAWRDASGDAQPLRLLAAIEALDDTDQTDQGDDR